MRYKALDENEKRLYEIFEEIGITEYEVKEHPAVYTMEEVERYGLAGEGLNLKNLLIKEKKTGRFFLIIIDDTRRVDMKHFKEVTGWKQVSFAGEEDLHTLLGVISGAVTPLALFNDTEKRITVVLADELASLPDDSGVTFHPCRNTASLTMSKGDFMRFLDYTGNSVIEE